MDTPQELYNKVFMDFVNEAATHTLHHEEALAAMKSLEAFSKIHVPVTEPEPIPEVVPTTFLGKAKATAAGVLDNETTRVLGKAAFAFAGVVVVAWTTIHRDHVIERQAMSQANQSNS